MQNYSHNINKQSITLMDVFVGDVYICSGQSNMAFLVEMAFNGTEEVQDEIIIHLFDFLQHQK